MIDTLRFACHRRRTRDPLTGEMLSEKQSQILDHLDEVHPLSLGARVSDAHSVLDPDLIDAMVASLDPDDRERALEGLMLLGRAATASHRARPRGWLDQSA